MEFYIFKNIYYDVFIYDILEKSNKKQKKVKKNESNVRAKSNDIFETTIMHMDFNNIDDLNDFTLHERVNEIVNMIVENNLA